jgi:predicted N-acetyltransferase YhbS
MNADNSYFHIKESSFSNRLYFNLNSEDKDLKKAILGEKGERKGLGVTEYGKVIGPILSAIGVAFKTKDEVGHTLYINKASFCNFIERLRQSQGKDHADQLSSMQQLYETGTKATQSTCKIFENLKQGMSNQEIKQITESMLAQAGIKNEPHLVETASILKEIVPPQQAEVPRVVGFILNAVNGPKFYPGCGLTYKETSTLVFDSKENREVEMKIRSGLREDGSMICEAYVDNVFVGKMNCTPSSPKDDFHYYGFDDRGERKDGQGFVYVDTLGSVQVQDKDSPFYNRYQGIGKALVMEAVKFSMEQGFDGRVKLTAFYEGSPLFYHQLGFRIYHYSQQESAKYDEELERAQKENRKVNPELFGNFTPQMYLPEASVHNLLPQARKESAADQHHIEKDITQVMPAQTRAEKQPPLVRPAAVRQKAEAPKQSEVPRVVGFILNAVNGPKFYPGCGLKYEETSTLVFDSKENREVEMKIRSGLREDGTMIYEAYIDNVFVGKMDCTPSTVYDLHSYGFDEQGERTDDGQGFIYVNNVGSVQVQDKDSPFYNRYKGIGKALMIEAVKFSVKQGFKGRVKITANYGSPPFHYQLGFRFYHYSKEKSAKYDAEVEKELQQAQEEKRKVNPDRFGNLSLEMYLPEEHVQNLLQQERKVQ